MTTQADSATALRMSLDRPTSGQQAATMPTLPSGWGCFVSEPDGPVRSRWYATPPYNADRIRTALGRDANGLASTLYADTWEALCAEAAEQHAMFRRLAAMWS